MTKYILTFLLLIASTCYAETEFSLEEINAKVGNGEVSHIWLVDGGIKGIIIDKTYGIAKEEFIIIGEYDKLPHDLKKLAKRNKVNIRSSQRNNDLPSPPSQQMQLFGIILSSLSAVVLFIMLILIYRKVSKVLKILESSKS